MTKLEIEWTDSGFKAFKIVRGTTPYFQSKKYDLFPMIRQLGPPHVFFTKSVHQNGMIHLIEALWQNDESIIYTKDEVKEMT